MYSFWTADKCTYWTARAPSYIQTFSCAIFTTIGATKCSTFCATYFTTFNAAHRSACDQSSNGTTVYAAIPETLVSTKQSTIKCPYWSAIWLPNCAASADTDQPAFLPTISAT